MSIYLILKLLFNKLFLFINLFTYQQNKINMFNNNLNIINYIYNIAYKLNMKSIQGEWVI